MNLDYTKYDRVIVAFSGGKDSLAALLSVLDGGCPKEKIELWHHLVDGREGSTLMDWAVTDDYCRKVADHFGIPCYFSWREGGFEREMLRENALTGGVKYEATNGELVYLPAADQKRFYNTRLKFPQKSRDLQTRWCSAYLKIDVAKRILSTDLRFRSGKTLFVTGERAQESDSKWEEKTPEERVGRASYAQFEPHTADMRNGKNYQRYIDHLRPVLYWDESLVWEIMERYAINPHPAYKLGWGRVSCAACIFGDVNQWASLQSVNPEQFNVIAEYEDRFGVTIDRKRNIREMAAKGVANIAITQEMIEMANDIIYREPIHIPGQWSLPAGAYSTESCGANV